MAVSKKTNTKHNFMIKTIWAIALILAGILLSVLQIGTQSFLGFPSLGIFLIYIGGIGLLMAFLLHFSDKKRIIDERAEHIGYKASRVTTLALILVLFFTMIVDGIYSISTPYYLYASFLMCFYVVFYTICYRIIATKN